MKRTIPHRAHLLTTTIILIAFACSPGLAAFAPDREKLAAIVQKMYPGAVINEIEPEEYQGREVIEVELTIGKERRRLLFSETFELLVDEKERSLPFIGGTLSLGLGVRGERPVYKGVDDEIEAMPAIIYRNGRFRMQAYDGINVSYLLLSPWGIDIALHGELAMEEFEAGDSPFLKGMDDAGTVFNMGLTATYPTRYGEFSFKAVGDVTGAHDGHELELSYEKSFTILSTTVTPSFGVEYMSEDVTEYYYGVSAKEERSWRKAYAPDSAVNFEAELMVRYPLTQRLDLVAMVEYTLLDSTITDSPIVDEEYEMDGTIGLLYTF